MTPSNKFATKPKPKREPVWQWVFEAIGTKWWIGVYGAPPNNIVALQTAVNKLIDDFDKLYSRFRHDSVIWRMSNRAGTFRLPERDKPMLQLYRQLYNLTDGQVTPLVGKLLQQTGYDEQYSLTPKAHIESVPAWDEVLNIDGNKATLHKPMLLDFGAAGKGHLVDLVSSLLRTYGIKQFCVDASGDMYCYGLSEALTVGLENPDNQSEAIGIADLSNQALCGSAPNRRQWGQYHHIMDPHAKMSAQSLKAVWVVADSALLADGLATALFFVDPKVLQATFLYSYALVYADGSLRYAQDFPGHFFAEEDT